MNSDDNSYDLIPGGKVPIKAWIRGVDCEPQAMQQLRNVASLDIVSPHLAVMPDCHWGNGATVGSVVPTKRAIIPAAVGVDIGCGMIARRTQLTSNDLGDNAQKIYDALQWIPVGGPGEVGSWREAPKHISAAWRDSGLYDEYTAMVEEYPKISHKNPSRQLGTLGGGNHFIEVCLDEADSVWFMLHSGSRGPGNRVGQTFIELAKQDMGVEVVHLPDRDLAYLREGTEHFNAYIKAVRWAQRYAALNRELMLDQVVKQVSHIVGQNVGQFEEAINCHHNYVEEEEHFGEKVWLTRKGAVRAQKGDLGIIPGSMGARSFIVRGLGNPDSFNSCSHGAGRLMSRGAAKRAITLKMHKEDTEGVICRKDKSVIDESPAAYKNIDNVMMAQRDLVEVVHTLKQVLCIKG